MRSSLGGVGALSVIGARPIDEHDVDVREGPARLGQPYRHALRQQERLKAQDIADLKSYLDTVTPVPSPSRPHDLAWPFSDRNAVGAWKMLNFNPRRDGDMSRGAYLVNVLGHCAECHSQRDFLGGKTGLSLAGNTNGPGGAKVPGLRDLATDGTPWTADNIKLSLQVGMKPNGDFLGDTMAEVVAHSSAKLSDKDRAAIAKYLLSLK
jgi:mono/diheme cytochrome c family protein